MKVATVAVFFIGCLTPAGSVPSDLKHGQLGTSQWWATPGMEMTTTGSSCKLTGPGRVLIQSQKPALTYQTEAATVMMKDPKSVVMVDQFEGQVRVMALKGKVAVQHQGQSYELTPSMQMMLIPTPASKNFLFDGVYRRPPMMETTIKDTKLVIRQFYMEQLVHGDPVLRRVSAMNPSGMELVQTLNKTSAILRVINGVDGYTANQL